MLRNNTSFSLQITSSLKKLYEEFKKDDDTKLRFYQYLVRAVMCDAEYGIGIDGNARGLLIYHSMGLGKTLLAASVAVAMVDLRKVIIMLPHSLKENFENTLEKLSKELNKDNCINFVSMDAYNSSEQMAKHSLDDKLLIIDEAHNFFRSIINNGSDLSNARKIYDLIMTAVNLRILFLTGTPSAKDPFELVPCFNMLTKTNLLPLDYETFYKLYINRDTLTIINRSKLSNRLLGLVSYATVGDSLIPNPTLHQKDKDFKNSSNNNSFVFPTELPQVIERVEMGTNQYRLYLMARDLEFLEKSRSTIISNKPPKALSMPSGNNGLNTYNVKSRTLSIFVAPNEYSKLDYDKMPDIAFNSETSPKLNLISDRLVESRGKSLVYSQFVETNGLKPLRRFMENKGFELYKSSKDGGSDLLDINSFIVGGNDNKFISIDKYSNNIVIEILNKHIDGLYNEDEKEKIISITQKEIKNINPWVIIGNEEYNFGFNSLVAVDNSLNTMSEQIIYRSGKTKNISLNYAKKPWSTFNLHHGQRKLFISEIQCLLHFLKSANEKIVLVYVGAAPCHHLPLLLELFPNVIWHLYDPAPFSHTISPELNKSSRSNVFIYNQYFTDDIAITWKNKCDIFISDIRLGAEMNGEAWSQAFEDQVAIDMKWQDNWVRYIIPKLGAMLKFRPPYISSDSDLHWEYIKGIPLFQCWPSNSSTETRLVVEHSDIVDENNNPVPPMVFSVVNYQNACSYHNMIGRCWGTYKPPADNMERVKGYDRCYDCTNEALCWKLYCEMKDAKKYKPYELMNKLTDVTHQKLMLINKGSERFPKMHGHNDKLPASLRMFKYYKMVDDSKLNKVGSGDLKLNNDIDKDIADKQDNLFNIPKEQIIEPIYKESTPVFEYKNKFYNTFKIKEEIKKLNIEPIELAMSDLSLLLDEIFLDENEKEISANMILENIDYYPNHMTIIRGVSLENPILVIDIDITNFNPLGLKIVDGLHRFMKATLDNKETIKAIKVPQSVLDKSIIIKRTIGGADNNIDFLINSCKSSLEEEHKQGNLLDIKLSDCEDFPFHSYFLPPFKQMYNNLLEIPNKYSPIWDKPQHDRFAMCVRIDPVDYENVDNICDHITEGIRILCPEQKYISPLMSWVNMKKEEHIEKYNPYNIVKNNKTQSAIYRDNIREKTRGCNLFSAGLAVYLFNRFVGEGGSLLDCTAGWGDRLIASFACGLGYYRGWDTNPNLQQVYNKIATTINGLSSDKQSNDKQSNDRLKNNGLIGINNELNKFRQLNTMDNKKLVHNVKSKVLDWKIEMAPFESAFVDFEHGNQYYEKFDSAFLSPPFYRQELYLGKETSTTKYKNEDDWYNNFYKPMFIMAINSIKVGGFILAYIPYGRMLEESKTLIESARGISFVMNYIGSVGMMALNANSHHKSVHHKLKIRDTYVWQKVPNYTEMALNEMKLLYTSNEKELILNITRKELKVEPELLENLPAIPYVKNLNRVGDNSIRPWLNFNLHHGQRKLFVGELQCILEYIKHVNDSIVVVYAGAAPCHHLPLLIELFPNIKWFLYDPRPFDKKFSPKLNVSTIKNVRIFNEFFTDEIAKSWTDKCDIFISDIRVNTEIEEGSWNQEFEDQVAIDMKQQSNWSKIIKPRLGGMLKFRPPYIVKKIDEWFYLKGKIIFQCWPSSSSTETRLLFDKNLIEIPYDILKYEQQLSYHNLIERPWGTFIPPADNLEKVEGYDRCYDCTNEALAFLTYIKMKNAHFTNVPVLMNLLTNTTHQKLIGKIKSSHGINNLCTSPERILKVVSLQSSSKVPPPLKKLAESVNESINELHFEQLKDESNTKLMKIHNSIIGSGEDKVLKYAIISGIIPDIERKKILDVFNSYENRNGDLIKVLLVSKTGAEGLDLKCVKFVHIIESYWDKAREDQVKARAIRSNSHIDLPENERTVQCYLYLSVANKKIQEEIPEKLREQYTIDEIFHTRALEKYKLNEEFRKLLREVSIECELFGGKNCKVCSPTNQKLFTEDPIADLNLPDVCESCTEKTIEALSFTYKDITYYYRDTIDNPSGIEFFKYSEEYNGNIKVEPYDPIFNELVKFIKG